MSRTTVSCLECLLATCLGLPHGQRNGGRPTFDLQKQVMITIRILGNPDACDQWPIDLTLQNRVYFVFIAEFVERLPKIFPINLWSTYLFEIEHRWAKWLISDPSPKRTGWIKDPMIRLWVAQISDPINPFPEWIWWISDLKMDLIESNATDQKSWSRFSQRNALSVFRSSVGRKCYHEIRNAKGQLHHQAELTFPFFSLATNLCENSFAVRHVS